MLALSDSEKIKLDRSTPTAGGGGGQNYGQSVALDGSTPTVGGGGGTNRRIGGG
jgi:hypothetical protein